MLLLVTFVIYGVLLFVLLLIAAFPELNFRFTVGGKKRKPLILEAVH